MDAERIDDVPEFVRTDFRKFKCQLDLLILQLKKDSAGELFQNPDPLKCFGALDLNL